MYLKIRNNIFYNSIIFVRIIKFQLSKYQTIKLAFHFEIIIDLFISYFVSFRIFLIILIICQTKTQNVDVAISKKVAF